MLSASWTKLILPSWDRAILIWHPVLNMSNSKASNVTHTDSEISDQMKKSVDRYFEIPAEMLIKNASSNFT